jgi:hypothetical protein
MIRNKTSFYGEELLAPRPNPKLEDHPLLAVRDSLFNIFAANFHIGGRSSIRNLRTRHVVWWGPPHDLHFHNTSLLPPCLLFFDCLILKVETLHPSKRRASNTAGRTSDFAVVRCVWHIICKINKALYILEKLHRRSVLFSCYTDYSLKVSIHTEDPATGHLGTVISWF